jgi:hypothetical protein
MRGSHGTQPRRHPRPYDDVTMWTKWTKPRLTETADGGCVEINPGLFIHWRRDGDGKWSVRIAGDEGVSLVGIHQDTTAVVH